MSEPQKLTQDWSWGYDVEKPQLKIYDRTENYSVIEAQHPDLGRRWLYCANVGTLCT